MGKEGCKREYLDQEVLGRVIWCSSFRVFGKYLSVSKGGGTTFSQLGNFYRQLVDMNCPGNLQMPMFQLCNLSKIDEAPFLIFPPLIFTNSGIFILIILLCLLSKCPYKCPVRCVFVIGCNYSQWCKHN